MANQGLKFIDLFSGCGGFSTGLELAGHECLLGVDFNAAAIQSFSFNHPNAKTFCGPIQELSKDALISLMGKKIVGNTHLGVDLIVGGPPCQGFSTVGAGKVDDNRNKLFLEFVRIVKLLNPNMIILENVTGLLALKNEPILNEILKSFSKLGYQLAARILSAQNFGAASFRRRTFLVGVKSGDPNLFFPQPTHGLNCKNDILTVDESWAKLMKLSNGEMFNHEEEFSKIQGIDLERLHYIPEGEGIRYQRDEEKWLPKKLHYKINWNKLPENRFRQKKLQRLHGHLPSPTIMTSNRTYIHPRKNRYLTVREVAALQSFPASFQFMGSKTEQYRQIGNAVPPAIAYAFGKRIRKMIKNESHAKLKTDVVSIEQLRSSAFLY